MLAKQRAKRKDVTRGGTAVDGGNVNESDMKNK